MIKKLIFIFSIFCWLAPAWGLTLKIKRTDSDTPLDIPLHTAKRTEHSLAVKMADGSIYYADMEPVGKSFPGGVFARIDSQVYQIGPTSKFFVTTTPDTDSFSFKISAAGNFTVVWGDGAVQEIVRTDTNMVTYSHTYSTAGTYTIGIGGQATSYSTSSGIAAISFLNNQNIAAIDGSLGAIFSTIGDGSGAGQQPRFYRLFAGCWNLASQIPEQLFVGLHGPFVTNMFADIFYSCRNLTGSIPKNLFADVTGAPVQFGISYAFTDCVKLTGPIPENLFAGVSGDSGASSMFWRTFQGCTGLTSIPENLFGDISGPLSTNSFIDTFANCTGLRGQSAKINGKYLYEIWSDATAEQVGGCYDGATGLSDYANIPDAWR